MSTTGSQIRPAGQPGGSTFGLPDLSPEHYLRVLLHRKWIVLGLFFIISAGTAIVTYKLPDVYTSETVILVDPQQVPDTYVRPTVSGDVRNRLGTLSQQILSATRLQKVIETFNLYPEDRKRLPREDVINKMRGDISVQMVNDSGAKQDLEAFKIAYSGLNPQVTAQVTNELASLFIEENLKAREEMATGTSDFLANQLEETRKQLEQQEAKLRDFKLKHIGEMPEQQTSTIQLLGQLQTQLQAETDAINRAQQQKTYIQSMMAQTAPVVDLDAREQRPAAKASQGESAAKAKLAQLLSRYGEKYPEVQKLKQQIQEEDAQAAASAAQEKKEEPPAPSAPTPPPAPSYVNPVLESQLQALDSEIAKHKAEQDRLTKAITAYQSKLEAIPVREQEMTDLVRDYEMSKAHYASLLDKKLSADTATQLEIRQQGEKFTILDPAQVPQKPSKPKRPLYYAGGCVGGLAVGLVVGLATELFSMSITSAGQLTTNLGLTVLGVIPMIETRNDRKQRRRWILAGTTSGVAMILAFCAFLLYHYRDQIF